jgi:hypothetical protein
VFEIFGSLHWFLIGNSSSSEACLKQAQAAV